jgi:hypothetical protein
MQIDGKNISIGSLVIACAVIFWMFHGASKEVTESQIRIRDLQKLVQTLESKDTDLSHTITTVTTKPDGTVEKKIDKVEKNTKVISKKTVKDSDVTEQASSKKTVDLERYSVTVYKNLLNNTYAADVGARLGNSPFEAVGLTTDSGKDFYLGVRFKW